MVRRAVSKLQQLHELEEELQLPGAGIQPSSTAPQQGSAHTAAQPQARQPARYAQQAQQRQPPPHHDLRRSLEPVLSAIKEAHSEEGSQGASQRSSGRLGLESPGRSVSSAQQCGGQAAAGQEVGRMQRLQEQLATQMQQVRLAWVGC